jgi:hypothetical protein
MKYASTGPDLAQCASCGGVLIPAGDDWTHQDDTGCTGFGEPILCEHDCAMPAVVGGTACAACTGFSLPSIYTVSVLGSGRRSDEE